MAKKTITTPKGTAVYPWLNTADAKFGDPTYKVSLRVPADQAEAFANMLEDKFQDFYQSKLEEHGKKKMRTEDMPWDEEDGEYVFKLKLNKMGSSKKTGETWENKIAFYDAKGKPIPEGMVPKIGGGSTLRLSFEPNMWEVSGKLGIQLRIKGVQVIEARQGGGAPATAEDHGFGEEEGYSYSPDTFDSQEDGDEEQF